MKKKTLRTIISFIFTFFIAFFLFSMIVLTTTKFTVASPNYFMHTMNEVHYYDSTATELNKMIAQNAAPSGFPLDMFKNYVSVNDIKSDMVKYEKDVFAGKKSEVSTNVLKNRLIKDTDKYIHDKNIIMSVTLQSGVNQFIQTVLDKYQYLTQFPYLSNYAQVINVVKKLYTIAMPVLIIVTLILIFLLYRLNANKRRRNRYYAYFCIGAGLLISALPFFLYVSRFFEKINIRPKYMYELMVNMTKGYLLLNILIGFALIIIGFLIAYIPRKKCVQLLQSVFKRKQKHRHHHHHHTQQNTTEPTPE